MSAFKAASVSAVPISPTAHHCQAAASHINNTACSPTHRRKKKKQLFFFAVIKVHGLRAAVKHKTKTGASSRWNQIAAICCTSTCISSVSFLMHVIILIHPVSVEAIPQATGVSLQSEHTGLI